MKDHKDLEKANSEFLRRMESINFKLDQETINAKLSSVKLQLKTTKKNEIKRKRSLSHG